MIVTLYTVGYSNRTGDELITLLKGAGIACLVDVRAHPGSARHPQNSSDALRRILTAQEIAYHWAGRQLGGFRRPRMDSPHVALLADGLRGYADHMETEAFEKGIAQLVNLAMKSATAILCAEKSPGDCHRSLIADHLTLKGMRVVHLLDPGVSQEHQLDPRARTESGRLVYDRPSQQMLALH